LQYFVVFKMALRRSPSVMMPLGFPSSRMTARLGRLVFGCTAGTLVCIASLTWVRSFFPRLPPGWKMAKSFGLKSLAFIEGKRNQDVYF